MFTPTFNDETSLCEDVHGDPLASLNLAPLKRPVPRTEDWYRAQAEEQFAGLDDGLVKRAKVRDFIGYLKKIDRSYCANSRAQ